MPVFLCSRSAPAERYLFGRALATQKTLDRSPFAKLIPTEHARIGSPVYISPAFAPNDRRFGGQAHDQPIATFPRPSAI
jgi:hypothetical protein